MKGARIRQPRLRRPRDRRGGIGRTVLGIVLALLAYVMVVDIVANVMWFSSVDARQVFVTRLVTRIGLFLVFGLAMAAAVGGSLLVAQRSRPKVRPPAGSAMLARWRSVMDGRSRQAVLLPALVTGVFGGLAATSKADTYLAWRHATPFGIKDPWSGLDASFFVFSYPWWRFVISYGIVTLVICLISATMTHLTNGALRAMASQGGRKPRSPFDSPAQAQLSLLMAGLLVFYGINQLLDRVGFAVTANSRFTGVNYTDDHARATGKLVVAVIAFLCAALMVVNARLRRWPLAITTLIVMLVSSIVVSGLYPFVLQRFNVGPSEQTKEPPYIAAHLTATRQAYGIDSAEIVDYPAVTTASAGQLRADAAALPAIRLMDPAVIGPTFEQRQQVRGYYTFPRDLDVDRYVVKGKVTDAVVAVREIDSDKLGDRSWNNLHTVYTHGYGLVAAYGNQRERNGEPVWLAGDLPSKGEIKESQPRIYFGENARHYVVVGAPAGADPVELDLPSGGDIGQEKKNTYDGSGGVPIGSLWRRVLFASHFGDLNLLLSNRVNSESKLLYNRTPRVRVQEVAPWLQADSDPYPAVVDGRVVWIVDAYTTSNSFPNSEQVNYGAVTADSTSAGGPDRSVNYLRNSVKAVVDAYDGSVSLYAWDEADPILQTWMKVFPGQVKPKSSIPGELLQHLRYPQDMFKAQRHVLGRYHTTNPLTFLQGSDVWRVPDDPVHEGEGAEPPYYLSIKWPGDDEPIFSQTSVFVPENRENLRAYMAANADASSPDYGKIRILRMSDAQQIAGPSQTMNAITTNTVVAEKLRPFLNQGSAEAIYGNLMTLPMGGGLLYVQPIYTQRQATGEGGYPALRFVVVRFGEHVGIGDTLQVALDQVFGGDAGGDTEEKPTDKPDNTKANPTVTKLLGEADAAFKAADKALKAGNLAEYGKQYEIARTKVAQALAAAKQG